LDPFEGLDDEDIRTAIANANGPRPCLFVPEIAFDLLVRRQIARLEQPGLQCVDLVFDEMQRMAFQSETTELSRFPELRDRVYEIVNNLLRSCVSPTQKMISNLIQLELAYINTSHPDFIGGKRAVAQIQNKNLASNTTTSTSTNSSSSSGNGHRGAENHNTSNISDPSPAVKDKSGDGNPPVPPSTSKNGSEGKGLFGLLKGNTAASSSNISQGFVKDSSLVKLPQVPEKMRSCVTPTDRERVETEIIKALISSYFDVVKKNYMDLVPKTIMHFLVNNFKDTLQNELVSQLYREGIMTELMRETEDIASRRKAGKQMKELLQRALEIVNEVRDFNTFK